ANRSPTTTISPRARSVPCTSRSTGSEMPRSISRTEPTLSLRRLLIGSFTRPNSAVTVTVTSSKLDMLPRGAPPDDGPTEGNSGTFATTAPGPASSPSFRTMPPSSMASSFRHRVNAKRLQRSGSPRPAEKLRRLSDLGDDRLVDPLVEQDHVADLE